MYKKISALLIMTAVVIVPAVASAHVVVKPAEVGIGSYETYSVNVPVEKEVPTVAVRLVIPGGLKYVQPNVKPGWTIDEKKTGDGLDATVTEINWTGGSIPADQRDSFAFAAQAPAKPTSLDWKAYQTYEDGSVVSWDQNPTGKDDEDATPYSVTKVIDDLKPAATTTTKTSDNNSTLGLVFGALAIVISIAGLLARRRQS